MKISLHTIRRKPKERRIRDHERLNAEARRERGGGGGKGNLSIRVRDSPILGVSSGELTLTSLRRGVKR